MNNQLFIPMDQENQYMFVPSITPVRSPFTSLTSNTSIDDTQAIVEVNAREANRVRYETLVRQHQDNVGIIIPNLPNIPRSLGGEREINVRLLEHMRDVSGLDRPTPRRFSFAPEPLYFGQDDEQGNPIFRLPFSRIDRL